MKTLLCYYWLYCQTVAKQGIAETASYRAFFTEGPSAFVWPPAGAVWQRPV